MSDGAYQGWEMSQRAAEERKEPRCPKCGERPRTVVVEKVRVRCEVNADGTPGRVLSLSRESGRVVGYECGGPCGEWRVG